MHISLTLWWFHYDVIMKFRSVAKNLKEKYELLRVCVCVVARARMNEYLCRNNYDGEVHPLLFQRQQKLEIVFDS